ncbi:cytochrome P450 4c3 [Leptinotarsa decemlineata]
MDSKVALEWSFLPPILFGIAITIFTYVWFSRREYLRKIEWVEEVPGLPFLGCILNLSKSTEILNVFSNYCRQYNGLARLNLFGKRFLLVSDYKFLEFVLNSNEILDKNDSYKFLNNWLGKGLLTVEGSKWKKSRKLLTPAFHFSIVDQFVEVFDNNANILVGLLEKEQENDFVDVFPYITMYTLDNICEATMGVSMNAQTDTQSEYVFAVKEMCRITVDRTFSPIKMFNTLYPLTADYYKEKKYVNTLHEKTNSIIISRQKELIRKRAEEISSGDSVPREDEGTGIKKRMAFLDLLLQTPDETLTNEDIRQEVDTFMFAGHDTTASAVSFIIYCLAEHPEHQEKIVEELETIFGDDKSRPVTVADLQNMKYTEMVINETLRLYPSVPFTGRILNKDVKYEDGKILPEGLSLILYIYGANRNGQYYEDPNTFNPLRFESEKPAPYSYIPFSAGPRNCIGQKFAMLEMKATVAKLLLKFEIVSCGHVPILAAETVLFSKNGVKVTLKTRM